MLFLLFFLFTPIRILCHFFSVIKLRCYSSEMLSLNQTALLGIIELFNATKVHKFDEL